MHTTNDPLLHVDPREAKLPAWVQRNLDSLRRRVQDAEKSAEEAALATAPDDSDAFIERYGVGGPNIGLGRRPRVTWRTGSNADMADIETRLIDDGYGGRNLRVSSQRGRIAVLPSAGNSVEVRAVDW